MICTHSMGGCHGKGTNQGNLLAVLMNLLMLGVSASPTTGSMNPLGDFEKMDASLEEYIVSMTQTQTLKLFSN